jgi:hypothetical protein
MSAKAAQRARAGGRGLLPGGRALAAPSWVRPGGVWDNACFLAGKVDEVGLLFLDSAASLGYGGDALPEELAALPLSWHVHLPLDLDWEGAGALETALALMDKAAFLDGRRAVLHPPAGPAKNAERALAAFARGWQKAGRSPADLLLENVRGQDLLALEACITACGFSVCPDLGHLLAHGQERLLDSLPLLARAGMLHLNAPSGRGQGGHRPLTCLDGRETSLARRLCGAVPQRAVVMLELFDWDQITASLPLARQWLA